MWNGELCGATVIKSFSLRRFCSYRQGQIQLLEIDPSSNNRGRKIKKRDPQKPQLLFWCIFFQRFQTLCPTCSIQKPTYLYMNTCHYHHSFFYFFLMHETIALSPPHSCIYIKIGIQVLFLSFIIKWVYRGVVV